MATGDAPKLKSAIVGRLPVKCSGANLLLLLVIAGCFAYTQSPLSRNAFQRVLPRPAHAESHERTAKTSTGLKSSGPAFAKLGTSLAQNEDEAVLKFARDIPAEFRPNHFELYVRTRYKIGWNESRSCLLPSMQLFFPQPNIVFVLDGNSSLDKEVAPKLAKVIVEEFPPLEARAVVVNDYPLLQGTKRYTGWQRGQLDMMFADRVVKAKYVGLTDTDTVFITVVTPWVIFAHDGRPIVYGVIGRSAKGGWWAKVAQGVFFVLKRPSAISCMSYFPVTLATEHIAKMRVHVEKAHGKSFLEVYKELIFKFGFYCHFSIMCNYVWHFHRNEYDFHYQNYLRFNEGWNTSRPGEVSDFSFLTEENTKPIVRASTHFSWTSFGLPFDKPNGVILNKYGRFRHLRNAYTLDRVRPMLMNAFCHSALAQCRNAKECRTFSEPCSRIGASEEKLQTSLFRFEVGQTWEWDRRVLQAQKDYYRTVRTYHFWLSYGKHVLRNHIMADYRMIIL